MPLLGPTSSDKWLDFQVIDAFTDEAFGGNPAAVILLDPRNGVDLTDEQKITIAAEFNLSETAYLTPTYTQPNTFKLQWATPTSFVDLCGHATFASTSFLTSLSSLADEKKFKYQTASGELIGVINVNSEQEKTLELNFPDDVPKQVTKPEFLDEYEAAFKRATRGKVDAQISKIWRGRDDLFFELEIAQEEKHLGEWDIDISAITTLPDNPRAVVFTTLLPQSASSSSDQPKFHSRVFGPNIGVPEDPVTGSSHCCLAVIYAQKLSETQGQDVTMWATQGGPRRGKIGVVWDKANGRVKLRGGAIKVSEGRIRVPTSKMTGSSTPFQETVGTKHAIQEQTEFEPNQVSVNENLPEQAISPNEDRQTHSPIVTALSHGGIPALKEDIASASLVSSPLVPAKKDYKKVFLAKNHEDAGKVNVVLISTGSVASIKVPVMVESLLQDPRIRVQVVVTDPSLQFYKPEEIRRYSTPQNHLDVWTDKDDWNSWEAKGDPILHVELRRWADIVLIAPCSANTLAKISSGICDNLATSLLRALPSNTPTYVFPAMNTNMYTHPLTAKQLKIVEEDLGYKVIGPMGSKALACGDVGIGAMTEWTEIVDLVKSQMDDVLETKRL